MAVPRINKETIALKDSKKKTAKAIQAFKMRAMVAPLVRCIFFKRFSANAKAIQIT